MSAQSEVERLLSESGAELIREDKHLVFRLPNGRNFVCSKTPSDVRSAHRRLQDLRRALGVKNQGQGPGERRERKATAGPARPKLKLKQERRNEHEFMGDCADCRRHTLVSKRRTSIFLTPLCRSCGIKGQWEIERLAQGLRVIVGRHAGASQKAGA